MFCTTLETEGEVVHVIPVLGPQLFITDRSNAVVLLWFSVVCFGVRVSVTLRLTCVHIIGFLSGHLLGNSCLLS